MTNRFQSRVVITGIIQSKPGARIRKQGSSHGSTPELYILKDLSGMPYISGSNFKNYLRRQIDSVLRDTLGPGFSCDSFNRERSCIRLGEAKPDGGVYLQDLLESCGENDERLFDSIQKHSCISCKLFGSLLIESQITCDDLKPAAWISSIKNHKKEELKQDSPQNNNDVIPDRFMIRVALANCEPWKRGLFIMGLSRAQNKLITLSAGRQSEQRIATVEELTVRSLESARNLFEKLSKLEATDGNEVKTEQLQDWIAALRDYLKLASAYARAS